MSAVLKHEQEPAQLAATPNTTAVSPATLLQLAVQQGADLDRLEKLMALQERWEANQARKAFVDAMAEFKQHPIEIFKTKNVHFTSSKGAVDYNHAELSDVCDAIVPALAKVGVSHRWDVKQEDGQVVVTCLLTHRQGHSESLTLRGPKDDSGTKNNLQAIASTVTYLQRYSLLSITGSATKSMRDDDGHEGGKDPDPELLNDDQIDNIDTLCKGIGPHMLKAVLEAYKVKTLADVEARYYESIVARLNAKRQEGAK